MPDRPEDLKNHLCIPFGRQNAWKLRGPDGKVRSVQVSGPIMVNFGDAIWDLVLSGMGIGHAALWRAGDDLRAGLAGILSGARDQNLGCPPAGAHHAKARASVSGVYAGSDP